MATVFKRDGSRAYYAEWTDHTGKRRKRSTGTRDRRAAQGIAARWEEDARRVRMGYATSAEVDLKAHRAVPIMDHVEAYLAFCDQQGLAATNIVEKRRHLTRMVEEAGLASLADLTAERLTGNMATMQVTHRDGTDDDGNPRWKRKPASARSRNFRRQTAIAFANWCAKTGRLTANPLLWVKTADETRDRRRIRRALTRDEVAALMAVAREADSTPKAYRTNPRRAAWYAAAFYAGLRRGDLLRLRWADVNLTERSLTIRDGKAKRVDRLPIAPELLAELEAIRPRMQLRPDDRVFPQEVTNATRRRDFRKAGIREVDDRGHAVDLHALRTTLGTELAKAGVPIQQTQRLMRHADYRTTQKHYTDLTLADDHAAIAALAARPTTNATTSG